MLVTRCVGKVYFIAKLPGHGRSALPYGLALPSLAVLNPLLSTQVGAMVATTAITLGVRASSPGWCISARVVENHHHCDLGKVGNYLGVSIVFNGLASGLAMVTLLLYDLTSADGL
jgi:hypothetical protein